MTSFDKSDKTKPEDSPRDVGAGADLKAAPRQDEGAVADASSPDGSNSAGQHASSKGGGFFAQLFKYGGVSFAQTFVELGVFALLNVFVGFSAANFVAVVCSATFHYVMNRNITFKSSSSYARSITLFVLLWVWNLAFSTFAITQLAALGWSQMLAKLITMGCQGVWGFLLSKYVIFR